MLGFYDGQEYQYFKTVRKFVEFLKVSKTPKDIYAHNGGRFDFMFIIKELVKHDDIQIVSIIPRGSSLLSVEVKIKDRTVIFRDSLALLSFPLRDLTKNFDVATKKGEWDHNKTTGATPELIEYNKSDCLGLYEVLFKFWEQPIIKKAGPANTIASQALKVFQTFMEDDHDSCSRIIDHFCRKAYFGGRTEIFKPIHKNEKQKLYEYDINSMYPFVMKEMEYPIGKGIITYREVPGKLGVYEAEVECPEDLHLPVLGILYNGKYCFPKGKFSGRWTNKELDLARQKGYKVIIRHGVYWPHSKKIFADYVNTLYDMRKKAEKNSVQDIICKLLLNSLYGRFALNCDRENITLDFKEATKEYQSLDMAGLKIELFIKEVKLETWTYSPWSVFVTSYARIHLYSFFDESVYYCDTDSVFTTTTRESSKELGGLKLENEYTSAVFLLPKTYSLKGIINKIRMKGIEKKLLEQVSHDEVLSLFEGKLKTLKFLRGPKFMNFKTALRKKVIVGMDSDQVKEIRAKYDKREIYKQGNEWLTKPITIKGETHGTTNNYYAVAS